MIFFAVMNYLGHFRIMTCVYHFTGSDKGQSDDVYTAEECPKSQVDYHVSVTCLGYGQYYHRHMCRLLCLYYSVVIGLIQHFNFDETNLVVSLQSLYHNTAKCSGFDDMSDVMCKLAG